MIRRRRSGMSLGRVAKKAAVATVVHRVVNNAMDNRIDRNMNRNKHQGFGRQSVNSQQPIMNNSCPSCHTGNPQGAKYCLSCGEEFANTQQIASVNSCPGCKANLVGVNGNFCPYCRCSIK